MSYSITYGLLLEVTILHNYFLNNGEETFASMSNDDKEKMLQKFSTDVFTTITPTLETHTILQNYKMVFKESKTGFKIYIKVKEADETDPFIKVPADLNLNFLITVHDYQFENYKLIAEGKGFLLVSSSPLTRSSYHASEDFEILKSKRINKLI